VRTHPTAVRRGRSVVVAAVAALLLGACGDGGPAAGPAEEPAGATTSAAPEQDGPNPVVDDDFPDPDVLEVDGVYYAYATEGNLKNVRVARSSDLLEWEALPDALPDLPAWVVPGKTWAPEVTEIAPGQYVLYFTATNFSPTLQCIGAATATSPEGPFTVVGEGMLVCPTEEGGAIDASTFLDTDGTRYLLWKNDGNCCGFDTWLYLAPLSPDGVTLAGAPTRLVKQDQPWEGNLVEAPTLVERDGVYTLLYSANDYGGEKYAIGWATASSVLGPYTKGDEPLLTTAEVPEYVGPGGQDVVVGPDGEDLLVFHSWYGDTTYRGMNVLPLEWEDGVPVVDVG
jgi:arabinan endo-1,5-alpha-L-arabinosidase